MFQHQLLQGNILNLKNRYNKNKNKIMFGANNNDNY